MSVTLPLYKFKIILFFFLYIFSLHLALSLFIIIHFLSSDLLYIRLTITEKLNQDWVPYTIIIKVYIIVILLWITVYIIL